MDAGDMKQGTEPDGRVVKGKHSHRTESEEQVEHTSKRPRLIKSPIEPRDPYSSLQLQATHNPQVELIRRRTRSFPEVSIVHPGTGWVESQDKRSLLENCTGVPVQTRGVRSVEKGFASNPVETPQEQSPRARNPENLPLTEDNLENFDTRSFSDHSSPTSIKKAALEEWGFVNMGITKRPKPLLATDAGFQSTLMGNGVFRPLYSNAPTNIDELIERLSGPCETPAPDEATYKRYLNAANCGGETVKYALSGFLKSYCGTYSTVCGQEFSHYSSKNVGLNNLLSPPVPDIVQGIHIRDFEPTIVTRLKASAKPAGHESIVALPHMAGEFNRDGESADLTRARAAYDAACLVHARNEARELMGKPDPAGAAYIGTFVAEATRITIFAHFATKNPLGNAEYHQYPVDDILITSSYENFKSGVQKLRNLEDWAMKNAYALKEELTKWNRLHPSESCG